MGGSRQSREEGACRTEPSDYDAGQEKQDRPVNEDGQQVVQSVTVADIDKIGPVCTNILGIFD